MKISCVARKFALFMPAAVAMLGLSMTTANPANAGGNWLPAGANSGERSIEVGGGGGFKPKYEGSNEYEGIAFPLVIPQFGQNIFSGRLDVRGIDDVRFTAFRTDPTGRSGFVAGPLVGYRFEREQTDGDLLLGLGDVDGGIVAGAFVGYRFGWLGFDTAYKHQFGEDDAGYLIDFSLTAKQQVAPNLELTGRVGTTYADEDYTQTFFGVTAAQANNSVAMLQAFDTDAGIKDVYVQLGSKLNLTDRWTARGQVRYSRLVGDAADSPIVESENQFSGNASLTYRFNLD